MNSQTFNGCIPALMTPCRDDRKPDFDALVRRARELVDIGMSAVVYCGSMGDWPLLSNAERMEGVDRLVGENVPTVVGTGAVDTASAVALADHAQTVGADGLMVIPRVLSRGTSHAAQHAHFSAILAAAPELPAVIYNSPYYGFATRADLFFELRNKHANLIGFKEFGGAEDLRYAGEFITGKDDDLMLMVGVDTQVFHGYVNCGARGTITGIGNVLPAEVLHLVWLCEEASAGNVAARRQALELEQALAVLSSFDEGPDLVLYYKFLLSLGAKEYQLNFNESDTLSMSQQKYAEAQFRLFRSWYRNWCQQPEIIAKSA